ncbi:competence protein ComFA [Enterococcus sp. AZ150]|uniref:Uncharacterized protein n=1 Tax=Enterococcus sulfureus ATCC 49903 TaxID=1140003 RepID=S0KR11_9ENTE|nr:DEAD/DEAH box helicase [Enterococcus sulfureus]EOT47067.1 hypothetical protein OMY_01317 [Enterococcus sulfureus ATCC 49903]EOT83638.1 hypothetical protein I573_01363 [Enterococcus sulfureus ATCC 49903]
MDEGKMQVVSQIDYPTSRPALIASRNNYHCQRCNFQFTFPNDHPVVYCPACARYGKVTLEDGLLMGPTIQHNQVFGCAWQGQLTKAQQKVADQLVEGVKNGEDQLVWAVTGAGKTEMMFPVITFILNQKGRIVIASPRVDVCRELYPRLRDAFPTVDCVLLHGDAEEKYRYSQLTVCTAHQLIHFYQAFDLLILDEADAFPYEGDQQLLYAQEQAVTTLGTRIFLTATPSRHLLQQLPTNTKQRTLPKRFHGRDLPVPHLAFHTDWQELTKRTIKKLSRLVEHLASQTFTLIFCPSIELVQSVYKVLKTTLPNYRVACVHANEEERHLIVTNAREESYDILVTTTILERGVTFPKVSVVVLAADHRVYSKSALVQIAGRVDRKGDVVMGEVWFLYRRKTKAIKAACAEIKQMNRLAKSDEV